MVCSVFYPFVSQIITALQLSDVGVLLKMGMSADIVVPVNKLQVNREDKKKNITKISF